MANLPTVRLGFVRLISEANNILNRGSVPKETERANFVGFMNLAGEKSHAENGLREKRNEMRVEGRKENASSATTTVLTSVTKAKVGNL